MDVKKKIEELAARLRDDKELQGRFLREPVPTLEELLGIDLPEEQLKQLADGVTAKLGLDKAGSLIGGLLGRK